MFLHVMKDEKFCDTVIELFEASKPGLSTYLVCVDSRKAPLKHVKFSGVIVVEYNSPEHLHYIRTLKPNDVLIMHSIFKSFYQSVLIAPDKVKVVWSAYGGDFYDTPLYKKNFYHKYTKAFFKYKLVFIISRLKKYLMELRGCDDTKTFEKVIRRIDYFSSPLANAEAELIKESVPTFKAKVAYFRNNSIEQLLGGLIYKDYKLGGGILIGNSNTPSNNHVDIFKKLKKIECVQRQIFVPLNYGPNERYKEFVLREGNAIFGEKFLPILNFINPDSYVETILLQCKTVIFYHERQQAVANTLIALWLGSKVFLSENSVVYKEMTKMGLLVYSFQKSTLEEINGDLSHTEKMNNRKVLLKEFGYNKSLERINSFIKTVS